MSASSPSGRNNEEKKGSFRFPAELLYYSLGKLKTIGRDLSAPGCIVRRLSAWPLCAAAALGDAAECLLLAKRGAPMSASIPAPRPSSRQLPAAAHSSGLVCHPPEGWSKDGRSPMPQPALLQKQPRPPSGKHPRMGYRALEPKH